MMTETDVLLNVMTGTPHNLTRVRGLRYLTLLDNATADDSLNTTSAPDEKICVGVNITELFFGDYQFGFRLPLQP